MKKVTISGEPDELVLDPDFYAHKDGAAYKVHSSSRNYTAGNLMGKFKYVLDEDENILATSYPMLGLDNDFELLDRFALNKMRAKIKSVDALLTSE